MTRTASTIARCAWWALLGAVVALTVAVIAPLAVGGGPVVVASGSMSPAIQTGEIALTRPIRADSARVGDIITFGDPSRGGQTVSHRLLGMRIEGRRARMVTRGDANSTSEHWSVPVDGRVGRLIYTLPGSHHLTALIWHPEVGLWAALVPIALLALLELVAVWTRREPALGPEAAATGSSGA